MFGDIYINESKVNKPDLGSKMFEKDSVGDNLNPEIDKLLDVYIKELTRKDNFIPVHVDEITSKLAKSYETVRKIIDWKDDNVLRRGAIERILKRMLFPKVSGLTTKTSDSTSLAEKLTIELIRGGHLPNDAVARKWVSEAAVALEKYLFLIEKLNRYKSWDVKRKINYSTFILEIASCEIEEILTKSTKERGIIEAMCLTLADRIQVEGVELSSEAIRRQIYAASCRALYDLDDNFIIYQLLKEKYPDWNAPDELGKQRIADNLENDWRELQTEIDLPVSTKFLTVVERMDAVFLLIDDILEKYKEKPKKLRRIFRDKKKFNFEILKAYDARLKTLKRRLFRLAIFSTLSVFLSNWFTFFVVEIPLAHIFYEKFNLQAAIADFLIPTIVMFILVAIIRPPNDKNIKKVKIAALGLTYNDEKQENYQVKMRVKKLTVFSFVMYIFYSLTMVGVFYGIGYIFYIAKLPITSVVFDTFTIALTVYAAVLIKRKAKELNVGHHASVFDFLMDIISVPIAKVGSFFAAKWKEYNIVAIVFNYLVEMPFTLILDFIQEWSEFITERKAELR